MYVQTHKHIHYYQLGENNFTKSIESFFMHGVDSLCTLVSPFFRKTNSRHHKKRNLTVKVTRGLFVHDLNTELF